MNANSFERLVPELRQQFPSLTREVAGRQAIYLDGPAGSQVPHCVIEAVSDYYRYHNANRAGKFPTSIETDATLEQAHQAGADWFGTTDPSEVVFGANMTTLTFQFSRALSKTWQPGDRVLVTQLDHDGNVTPWRLAARDVGVEVDQAKICLDDATLDLDDFANKLNSRTRLVAVTCASNSVGSRTPISVLADLAHNVGAEVYLDAVHLAPHSLLDVNSWNADYCVCSAYKFFGPHVGMLWGRKMRFEELTPYKLRPAPSITPGKWMTGTQNHAAIAGVTAAINYVADIGRHCEPSVTTRREALRSAFRNIEIYERQLVQHLLEGLLAIKKVTVYGITSTTNLPNRVPTVACNIAGIPSAKAAELLAQRGIFCWHGDYYAVDVCESLGQQPQGMVRLGIMHTNTLEEIDMTLEAVRQIAAA